MRKPPIPSPANWRYSAPKQRARRVLSALTPAGATYVSDDFLAGLLLRTPEFRHEYVGDAAGERAGADLPLHAIMLK